MATFKPGVLVDRDWQQLAESGGITGKPLVEGQIQPASMDVRVGGKGYRVQAGVLPGSGGKVQSRLQPLVMADLDFSQPQLLERGAVYVVELAEGLNLPPEVLGTVSPKSSTGRLDIFVRLVTDGASTYDTIPAGYVGPLYLEIMPLTFPILLHEGDRLTQLRLRVGETALGDAEVVAWHAAVPLAYLPHGEPETPAHVAEGLWTTIDLKGDPTAKNPVVGYRARHHTQPIDLGKIGHYPCELFWEPLRRDDCHPLILHPGEFYIFVSRERLRVPPELAAELIAYDTRIGELRVHYAGFFDPGFGYDPAGNRSGTPAVLEVRAHDVPFVLEHGQRIGRFIYERLQAPPTKLYGSGIGSNYAAQGLKLAKQFKTGQD